MFSVILVARFCGDGCIKNAPEEKKKLQVYLLFLVQVLGVFSGCALCEESYTDSS